VRLLAVLLSLLLCAQADEPRKSWAFAPIRPPQPGESIDGFLDAKLAAQKLTPAAPAAPMTLLRRLHFVLTGLPPTLDQQDCFAYLVQNEGLEKALAQTADTLLASPHFCERWAQHWLDVVRFAETKGHEYDYEIEGAWRYRDWLIQALNADLPFADFVREQICGDLLPPRPDARGENQARLATIFWNLGESATSPVDLPNDEGDRLSSQIDTFGKAFLGLTIACARCHDHKVDPISQRDYTALLGVLANSPLDRAWTDESQFAAAAEKLRALRTKTEQTATPIEIPPVSLGSGRLFADFTHGLPEGWHLAGYAETITPALAAVRGVQPGLWSGLLSRRLPARVRSPIFPIESRYIDVVVSGVDASLILSVHNLQVIRDPIYEELRRRIDRAGEWQVHRFRVARWLGAPAYLEAFTGRIDLLKTQATVRQQFGLRAVIFTDGGQTPDPPFAALPTPTADAAAHAAAAEMLALESTLPLPEHFCAVSEPARALDRPLAKRGDANQPGALVPRGFLEVLGGQKPAHGSGRRELAEAVLAPDNPLTARVFVNRVWQHVFGRGLVGTPDDFGMLGEAPTHPELLDFLAHRFAREGSLKRLLRELVLTRAFQRASADDDTLLRAYPLRRLDAEALRDALLAVSGRLDPAIGGPSVPVRIAGDFFGGGIKPAETGAVDGAGRRSLYLKVRRNFPDPFLAVFDKPAPAACFGKRNVSNVPAQALALLNDPLVTGQAEIWARRLLAEPVARGERLARLFREALARSPTEAEVQAADEFLASRDDLAAWADYAHTLFNTKEFLYVP
jgi:hypothetical protein